MTTISYSELYKWDSCKRQWYYSYGLKLKPLEISDAMNTGVKGHKLLQDFYNLLAEGKTKEEALKEVAASAQRIVLADNKFDGTIMKSWLMVDNYIRTTDFKTKAVLVENRFQFPVSALDSDPALSHIQIGFTPDIVFERQGGFHDVEDYKFVGRAWSKSKKDRYSQAKLYQIFLRRMGYKVSRTTVRFFNTTTYKVDEQNYTLEPNEEQILIDDFVEAVREVARFRAKPEYTLKNTRRTMNYSTCQYCAFAYPCTLEAKGKDASNTLRTQYKANDYDYNA